MIQIIGLRTYTDKTGKDRTTHKHFSNASSVTALFSNIDQFIETLPVEERYNLYYTALDCVDPKMVGGALRKFKSQSIIPFDIDNIDMKQIEKYIAIFFKVTELDDSKCGIVNTGNGLQILTQLEKPFEKEDYFLEKRDHYKTICQKLDEAFKAAGLPGDADPAVWSGARLLRLPGTENRKPKKGIKQAKLLYQGLAPQEFTWIEPETTDKPKTEESSSKGAASFGKVDHKEIFQKCDFIRWAQTKPEEVREPAFYAALSILARMEKGEDKCRALFDKIKNSGSDSSVGAYGEGEYQDKLKAALENAKPRTCKNIDSVMGWAGKCKSCKVYGTVNSPISIRGKEFIATEKQGFHKTSDKGKLIPQYEDLLKFFDRTYYHKTIRENGEVMVWKDNYYQEYSRISLMAFAEKHFKPDPSTLIAKEFTEKVKRNSLEGPAFFHDNTKKLTNLKNGVLDRKTGELLPHSPMYGFKYILPYEYDKEAKCPKFLKFLNEVCCDDKNLIDILQEYMGYIVSGDEYWNHKCLIMVGEGSNGKGVFTRLLAEMVGSENHTALMVSELKEAKNKQLMDGKLFNLSDEVGAKDLEDPKIFKALTGNGEITVRAMYKDPYKMKNMAKLVMNCNELPATMDDSEGFLRRFCIVPFNQTFKGKERNPFLFDELVKERPGILNFALEGHKRLVKYKDFTQSEASRRELSDYSTSNNPVRWWYEEQNPIEVKPLNGRNTHARLDEMYELWMDYNIGKSRKDERTQTEFNKEMTRIIPQGKSRKRRKRYGTRNLTGFDDVVIHKNKG